MAFVIKKTKSYFWPVKLKSPKDGGGYESQTLNLEFRKLKNSELKSLLREKKEDADLDFCKKVITGWKDIKDDDGNEINFSLESLEIVLDEQGFLGQVVNQYLESISGAIEKN